MDARTKERFNRIQRVYEHALPEWIEEYEKTGAMHHDPYLDDLLTEFTPIEAAVWSDIRCAGIPFYPQIPVLNYFIDFGCPFLRIGIECDGKEWHDAARDAKRDTRLAEVGWTIYRIEGHECKRIIDEPWRELYEEEEYDHEKVRDWFMKTSEGIIYSIKQAHFEVELSEFAKQHYGFIGATLAAHKSERWVNTPRMRPKAPSRPIRLSESLADYMTLIERRARRK